MSHDQPTLQKCASSSSLLPPASRASWIGTLSIADLAVPVKAYSVIGSPESQLHQVHSACGGRVTYQKVCERHGPLTADQISKTFAYSEGLLIGLSEDELSQFEPVDDKRICFERFFAVNQLDLTLLAGRSMVLTPANLAVTPSFALLKAGLDQTDSWGLGRTVFSQKRQLVVLQSQGQTLLLHTLHDPGLRRATVPVPAFEGEPARADLKRIVKLIADGRERPLEWARYRDDARERLADYVAQKVQKLGSARKQKAENQRRPQEGAYVTGTRCT